MRRETEPEQGTRMARRQSSSRTTLKAALQIGAGLAALAVFLLRVDLGEVLEQIAGIDLGWAALALIAFTGSKVLHGWRWWAFLNRREVPRAQLIGVFLMSNMANSVLPLRAGDLLRVEIPSHRFGLPRSTLVSSVFVVESVLDLFAFAVLLVVALTLADLPAVMRPLVWLVGGSAILLFGLLIVMARSRDVIGLLAVRVLRPSPRRFKAWVGATLPPFVDGMSALRTNRDVLRVVGVSLLAWLVEVGVYWLMARSFEVQLGLMQALILMIAANLIVSLPLTPWSVGPYELAVTEALVVLGAARSEAAAFALGSHLMLQAWIGVTGVAAMMWLRLGIRDLWPGRRPPEDAASAASRTEPPPARE